MTIFENDFSEEIWKSTYRYKDETLDGTFDRVSTAVAQAETTKEKQIEWKNKFKKLLEDFKFVPGGRILANAGTDYEGTTLLNCFTVGNSTRYDIDSIGGIFELLTRQATTLKSEGGVGFNFSHIRPRGGYIKGIGVESPGSIAFADIFNTSANAITSGSGKKAKMGKQKIRKGAQMLILNDWHPDIIEFIKSKQQPNKLDKFNISVGISNKFMKLVQKLNDENIDSDWELIFPDTTHIKYKSEWDGDIDKWLSKKYKVVNYNTVKVSYLWNLIMESTYNRNEPGVFFIDRANKLFPGNYLNERIDTTNPCVSGDTIISTNKGPLSVVDVISSEEDLKAWTYNEKTKKSELENIINSRKTKENADMIVLHISGGVTLKVTPDHLVYTTNRGYVEAGKLTTADRILYEKDKKINGIQ